LKGDIMSEALRLAELLECSMSRDISTELKAAAELRRLAAVEQELEEQKQATKTWENEAERRSDRYTKCAAELEALKRAISEAEPVAFHCIGEGLYYENDPYFNVHGGVSRRARTALHTQGDQMNTPKLPPLPMPDKQGCEDDPMYGIRPVDYYTAEQMQSYAIAAIQAQGVPDTNSEFNRAIDFAIEQGTEAAIFLRSWREGDTSEWYDFTPAPTPPAPQAKP
jgi:hypothetical protein